MLRKTSLFLLLIGLATAALAAQDTGRVAGTVYENYCRPLIKEVLVDDPGRATVGERGAAGVTLYLYSDEHGFAAETGADGSYAFADVPPAGNYWLGAFIRNYGVARADVALVGGDDLRVDLRLPFASPANLIVQFAPGTDTDAVMIWAAAYGFVEVRRLIGTIYVLRIPEWYYLQDFIEWLRFDPLVRSVGRDDILCPLG